MQWATPVTQPELHSQTLAFVFPPESIGKLSGRCRPCADLGCQSLHCSGRRLEIPWLQAATAPGICYRPYLQNNQTHTDNDFSLKRQDCRSLGSIGENGVALGHMEKYRFFPLCYFSFFFFFNFYFMYMTVVCMCIHSAPQRSEQVLGHLEPELQIALSLHMSAGN